MLKAGKSPSEYSSYRPVALLTSASKLAERVLYDQISTHISHEQHGYRRGQSVDTALASVTAQVAKALDCGKWVWISAFDFSAAFNTVKATILESKLSWASVHTRKLLMNYLHEGKQHVTWNGYTKRQMRSSMGSGKGLSLDHYFSSCWQGTYQRLWLETQILLHRPQSAFMPMTLWVSQPRRPGKMWREKWERLPPTSRHIQVWTVCVWAQEKTRH